MAKQLGKQITLAQNFLRSSQLVRLLIKQCAIGSSDTVCEIGPGHGIITAELAHIAHRVIAIEKDLALVQHLRARFRHMHNVNIIAGDFLRYHISARDYKIFANIPYNTTASIVRKILYVPPTPNAAYLVMQKEAAEKFAGCPTETQFSILAKPGFSFQIIRVLRRTDFRPIPNVDSVLLCIKKRRLRLIHKKDSVLYRDFVRYGFGRRRKSLKLIFKPIFTYQQWKRLAKDLHFPLDVTPSELTFEQWLGLFDCFKQRVPSYKQMCIKR